MRFVSKTSQKNQKISCAAIYFVKTRGARSIIGSFGSQLVSGDYHEDGAEEVGSPSQHALQLINIQNRNFLHYHLEKLWEFASIFR